MKHIAKGWDSYRKLVVPAGASEVQLRETERAFYAGAALLWEGLLRTLEGGTEPTNNDMQRAADIQAELDAYGQQLDRDILNLREH